MKSAQKDPSRQSSYRLAVPALLIAVISLAVVFGCKKRMDPSAGEECNCQMMCKPGPESNDLGPADFNANYHGFSVPVVPGERMVMRTQFPHARYISINIYDEKLRPLDAIRDYEIVPSNGVNPFVEGTDRNSDYLGEFEITVLMEPPPSGERPPNTLYAGLTHEGKPNKAVFLGYRVYLPDQDKGYRDGHPLGAYGAVPPPRTAVYDKDGGCYCPRKALSRMIYYRGAYSVLTAFLKQTRGQKDERGEPQDPPAWINQYSRDERQENLVVGNDDTIYISASVSSRFGEILVLRWPAASTPVDSYRGRPIEADVDMRYWSLAFAYRDPSYFAGFPTETSRSDVEVPRLKNGDCQLVIGFGGIARPDFVPKEQWVGLNMKDGIVIMRNIMIEPGYDGDFGRLPRGKITGETRKYTPGGVYCSADELENNPDIGLGRGD